jgi:uncharacterized protein
LAVEKGRISRAHIATLFLAADVLCVVTHFKGHMMTGFGGAIKNVGMGCATREGKLSQHCDVAPVVNADNCVGCQECMKVCPVAAISISSEKALVNDALCIGCASCIAACRYAAMDVDWEAGGDLLQEKMVEYAAAVLRGKKGKTVFINFATKITKECDCLAKDDPRIVPDIGILISSDPVSVDTACLDLVKKISGRDLFRDVHPKRNGVSQLRYAQELGVGTMEYRLITG